MQTPLFVRPLTADERATLETGLRSSSAFTVRRCQILLASAEGQPTTAIAGSLRCTDQTVRNVIHAFHQRGLTVQGHSVFVEVLHDRFPEAIKGCVRGGALLARQPST